MIQHLVSYALCKTLFSNKISQPRSLHTCGVSAISSELRKGSGILWPAYWWGIAAFRISIAATIHFTFQSLQVHWNVTLNTFGILLRWFPYHSRRIVLCKPICYFALRSHHHRLKPRQVLTTGGRRLFRLMTLFWREFCHMIFDLYFSWSVVIKFNGKGSVPWSCCVGALGIFRGNFMNSALCYLWRLLAFFSRDFKITGLPTERIKFFVCRCRLLLRLLGICAASY